MGVVGAIVSVASAAKSSHDQKSAASKSSKTQRQAAGAAISEERRQSDLDQENLLRSEARLEPFRQAALDAQTQQQALLGLSGQQAQQEALGAFEESAGQRFMREQGQKALLANASAIGGIGGGNVRRGLVEYGQGVASQNLQDQLTRLGAIAGQGAGVAGQQGQIMSNLAQFGGASTGRINQLQQGAGQARASGILGAQQAQSQLYGRIAQGAAGAMGSSGGWKGAVQGFASGYGS